MENNKLVNMTFPTNMDGSSPYEGEDIKIGRFTVTSWLNQYDEDDEPLYYVNIQDDNDEDEFYDIVEDIDSFWECGPHSLVIQCDEYGKPTEIGQRLLQKIEDFLINK